MVTGSRAVSWRARSRIWSAIIFFWREMIPEPHSERRLMATKQVAKTRDPHFRVTMNNRMGFCLVKDLQTKHVNTHNINQQAMYLIEELVILWVTRLYLKSDGNQKQCMTQVTKLMIQDPDSGYNFLTKRKIYIKWHERHSQYQRLHFVNLFRGSPAAEWIRA